MSDDYEEEKFEKFNVGYYVDIAREYFEERRLTMLFEMGNDLVTLGRFDAAKELLRSDMATDDEINLSRRFNPFDREEIRAFQTEREKDPSVLFSFTGPLKQLIGHVRRKWLVTTTAPEKVGKTHFLEEVTFVGSSYGHRVAWFSGEMSYDDLQERIYQRLTGRDFEPITSIRVPVFDCLLNQDGACELECRINKVPLADDVGDIPEYSENLKYRPCDVCRHDEDLRKYYKQAHWFTTIKDIPAIENSYIEEKADAWEKLYGKNRIRVIEFPPFQGTLEYVKNELIDMANVEGFIPDIVLVDSLDVLDVEPEARRLDTRGRINLTWQKAKNIANLQNVAFFTVDQAKANTHGKDTLRREDAWADDKRKNAHVDLKLSLNQTDQEYEDGIIRVGCLFRRKGKRDLRQVVMTQCLQLGQICMDSEFRYYPSHKERG